MRWWIVALALLVMSCRVGLFAQTFGGYIRKVWQAQDGLPEQTVQAFAQTKDHYLWIGTTGGLLRFDGAQFTDFNIENTPELKDNSIFALMVSRNGDLWIGTEGAGLLRYRDGKFQPFRETGGLSDRFVRALLQGRDGTIWVGTDTALLRVVGNRLQRIDGTNGIPPIGVHCLALDHSGALWVGGSRLLKINGPHVEEYRLGGPGSESQVKSVLETQDHTVWAGTVSGLERLRPGSHSFKRVSGVRGTVRVLRQTTDGSLWIGMIGDGILRRVDGKIFRFPETLPSNTVLNIFEDDETNIWIGTQAGMLRLTHTPAEVIRLPQSTDSDFGTIYQDRDGTLWVVSTDIFRLRNGVIRPYSIPALGNARARDIFRDRRGALWIGTDGDGLIRIDGKSILRLNTSNGLVNDFIRAIMEDRDGSMWFATDVGISHWISRKFVNYGMRDGLSYFSTRALVADHRGDIWIGTDRGISHLHDGKFLTDAATTALAHEKVWAIHEDPDGGLWFGTRNDGLYRWKNGHLNHYTTVEGLASNSIYEILEDAKGNLWISGPNGISVLNRHQLDLAAEQPNTHIPLTLYAISDEVENTQIYGGRQPAGCLGLHNDVWFASNKGPIHIVSGNSSMSYSPPIVINEVSIDGQPMTANGPITLEPEVERVEISYAPILLRSQEGMRFRYKLDGFDAGWIDSSSRRTATYTNLPAGKYKFHVVGFEASDPAATAETSLTIIQKPHFYGTWWFAIVCTLFTVTFAVGIYQVRLWQVKMRFQAVLDERGRLAREMHDTVIQGCTSISALLEAVASQGEPADPLAHDLMEHAREQARVTTNEARETVRNWRQNKPAESMLVPALQHLADKISKESGISVACEAEGKPFVLNQFATHELMMMAREAIYNAVFHADPANIVMKVIFADNYVSLGVKDDGAGFDLSILSSQDELHYGLLGMKERARALGGTFSLDTEIGKGTELQIQIPRRASAAQSAMLSA